MSSTSIPASGSSDKYDRELLDPSNLSKTNPNNSLETPEGTIKRKDSSVSLGVNQTDGPASADSGKVGSKPGHDKSQVALAPDGSQYYYQPEIIKEGDNRVKKDASEQGPLELIDYSTTTANERHKFEGTSGTNVSVATNVLGFQIHKKEYHKYSITIKPLSHDPRGFHPSKIQKKYLICRALWELKVQEKNAFTVTDYDSILLTSSAHLWASAGSDKGALQDITLGARLYRVEFKFKSTVSTGPALDTKDLHLLRLMALSGFISNADEGAIGRSFVYHDDIKTLVKGTPFGSPFELFKIARTHEMKLVQLSTGLGMRFRPTAYMAHGGAHVSDIIDFYRHNRDMALTDSDIHERVSAILKHSILQVNARSTASPAKAHLDEPFERFKTFAALADHTAAHGPVFKRDLKTSAMKEHFASYLRKNYQWSSVHGKDMDVKTQTSEWFPSDRLQTIPRSALHCGADIISKTASKEMVQFSRLTPGRQARMIEHFIRYAYTGATNSARDLTLMKLQARRLDLPTLSFGSCNLSGDDSKAQTQPRPENGSWKLTRPGVDSGKTTASIRKFKKPFKNSFRIGVIYDIPVDGRLKMLGDINLLRHKLMQAGLKPSFDSSQVQSCGPVVSASSVENAVRSVAPQCDVLVFYSHSKIKSNHYAAFKREAELVHGMVSTCIVVKDNSLNSNLCNIATKLNAKMASSCAFRILGSENDPEKSLDTSAEVGEGQGLALSSKDTMVIGSTVRYADPVLATPSTPAVFAMVASSYDGSDYAIDFSKSSAAVGFVDRAPIFDKTATSKATTDQSDDHRNKVIKQLKPLFSSLFKEHRKHNPSFPKRIVYFRTGANDAFFSEGVQNVEQDAINAACEDEEHFFGKDKNPQTTIITVRKQGAVRFYPSTYNEVEDNANNCAVGTVVDRAVVQKDRHAFYLQSHHVARTGGTARPTFYDVVRNAIKFTPDQIQRMVLDLCFASQAATGPLSQPVPTYYATQLANRARLWLDDYFTGTMTDRMAQELGFVARCYDMDEAKKIFLLDFLPKQDPGLVKRACEQRLGSAIYDGKEPHSVGEVNATPWHANLNGCKFWI